MVQEPRLCPKELRVYQKGKIAGFEMAKCLYVESKTSSPVNSIIFYREERVKLELLTGMANSDHCLVKLAVGTQEIILGGVYVKIGSFFSTIEMIDQMNEKFPNHPIFVIGDFNVNANVKLSQAPGRLHPSDTLFLRWLPKSNFKKVTDLPPNYKYKKVDKKVQNLIDFGLVTKKHKDMVTQLPTIEIKHSYSDHNILLFHITSKNTP